MRLLDLTLESPSENLAMDEALLLSVESGAAPDTLRFWESSKTFVVLGTGQKLDEEVHELHCREDGVGVYRRCTAGGCVIQGEGSLNFTIAASPERNGWARNLHESYCYILNSIAASLQLLGMSVRHEGICDLAWDGYKVSGNAQRRRRGAILHHGTLLYRADYGAMERYLKEPSLRPDYRGVRRHREFVRALPLSRSALKEAVMQAFRVRDQPGQPLPEELQETQRLALAKYLNDEWTRRR